MDERMRMPIVTLKNGLRVGNFSSPHAFQFDDGTVLPACSEERSRRATLHAVESLTCRQVRDISVTDVALDFEMTESVKNMLTAAAFEDVDVVIVPLPLYQSMPRWLREALKANGPQVEFRVIRIKDRVNKIAYSDRFCV